MLTKEEVWDLFSKEQFNEAEKKIKLELAEYDNADYFYFLFLAMNNDYSGIDLDNISNEIHFTKAIEIGLPRQVGLFNSEYNFYISLQKTLRDCFCYACRGNITKFNKALDRLKNDKIQLPADETELKKLYGNLDAVITQYDTPKSVVLNYYLVNLLYVISPDRILLALMKEFESEIQAFNKSGLQLVQMDTMDKVYEQLEKCISLLDGDDQQERDYQNAIKAYNEKEYLAAMTVFASMDYLESKMYYNKCLEKCKALEKSYQKALAKYNKRKYTEAAVDFKGLGPYKDSESYVNQCLEIDGNENSKYPKAKKYMEIGDYQTAKILLDSLDGYKESEKLLKICEENIAKENKRQKALNKKNKKENDILEKRNLKQTKKKNKIIEKRNKKIKAKEKRTAAAKGFGEGIAIFFGCFLAILPVIGFVGGIVFLSLFTNLTNNYNVMKWLALSVILGGLLVSVLCFFGSIEEMNGFTFYAGLFLIIDLIMLFVFFGVSNKDKYAIRRIDIDAYSMEKYTEGSTGYTKVYFRITNNCKKPITYCESSFKVYQDGVVVATYSGELNDLYFESGEVSLYDLKFSTTGKQDMFYISDPDTLTLEWEFTKIQFNYKKTVKYKKHNVKTISCSGTTKLANMLYPEYSDLSSNSYNFDYLLA